MTDDGNKKDKTTSEIQSDAYDPSRRKFIKNTGLVVGGIAGGSILGGLLTNQFTTDNALQSEQEGKAYTEARMFFTRFEDFVVLETATERIYPKDDNGPGAIELGVPYFIDKQMAGSWGINGTDYRHGPFISTAQTIDQSGMTRREVLITGLREMNKRSNEKFNVAFQEAEENEQNEILQEFQEGTIEMNGVNSSSFFTLLRTLTLEGVYSDPLYGGNRNMEGWKMMGYPGAVSSYADIIDSEEFVEKNPISLTDYQQKS